MKSDGHSGKPINYTQRMLWVLVGQVLFVVVLFNWSDFLPSWANRFLVALVILLPPLAYLAVLVNPRMRQAWRKLLRDVRALMVFVTVAFIRLFRPAVLMKLVRRVALLKPYPTTVDEWITYCVLPFKTCIVVAFPLMWVFQKICAHFQAPSWAISQSGGMVVMSYLISLLALLPCALVQAIFCRPGRATTTLAYFVLGVVVWLIWSAIPIARW